jgi:hypothetical protein
MIDGRERLDVALGQIRVRREEPVVLRFVADPRVERDQPVGIVRADRTHMRCRTVGQHDIGFPVRWVQRLSHGDSHDTSRPGGFRSLDRLDDQVR